MPIFRYKAMSQSGTILNGSVEAASQAAAIQHIRGLGHLPISAADATMDGWWAWLNRDILPQRKASQRDLGIITQELATLLHAGLPLERSLEILSGLDDTQDMKKPLVGVLARVRSGASLADALAADVTFPKLYVSMVRAGEMGGNVEATLRRLADYLTKAHAIRESITSALVYPVILLATAGMSIIVILLYVLPQFEPLFRNAGKTLPLATRIVMGMGNFLGLYGWVLALLAIGIAIWLRQNLRRPAFRERWDMLSLKLPLFGGLLTKIQMERFSRTLGALLSNGVALPTALGITKDTLSNSIIAKAVGDTAVSLREGEALADRLGRSKVFPAIALDFVRVGEETGKLDEMLLRQADIYEHAVKHTVERLLALLVPVLTIFLGMIVAGLIASMLIAILSINDLAVR